VFLRDDVYVDIFVHAVQTCVIRITLCCTLFMTFSSLPSISFPSAIFVLKILVSISFSSTRTRHTTFRTVTVVQTCALPISEEIWEIIERIENEKHVFAFDALSLKLRWLEINADS